MEFLRFGSSIPGKYWGCCACSIIQDFKQDPNEKASIQLVDGDANMPVKGLFAGPTWHDIFKQRIRVGEFSDRDMPNHAFFAILTEHQVNYSPGKEWLAILKENGFQFVAAVDNSVYSGQSLIEGPGKGCTSSHPNYIFALYRNIGSGAMADPFVAPAAWDALPDPYGGDMSALNQQKVQIELWNKVGKAKFLTEAQVVEAGAPVVYAGIRPGQGQNGASDPKLGYQGAQPETKDKREARIAAYTAMTNPAPAPSAFPAKAKKKGVDVLCEELEDACTDA